MSKVYISVDQREFDGAIQVSIGREGGSGYRIAGPKYDGNGRTLLKVLLSESEKKEIRGYLRACRVSTGQEPK